MKKLAFLLLTLVIFIPSISYAAPLTQTQAESLINVVQASPGTPASAFTDLITAFSNITVAQAESLIGVIQASPNEPPSSFVSLLEAFTQGTESTGTTQSQSQVSTPVSQPQTVNYSAQTLANNLASQLAYITCDYYNRYGNVLFTQSANGLLFEYSANKSIYGINTVLDAVENTAYAGYTIYPGTCNVQFPAGASLFAGGFSNTTAGTPGGQSPVNIPNQNIDFAQVLLPANNYLETYARAENYCLSRPSVGDTVAIFGWPSSGSFETHTGTVTGISGDFDMTDVTVPSGMQGSTAVSLTDGCILGQVTSSGEVVDQSNLSYLFGG